MKYIHCCWFGSNEQSELIKRCIKSWSDNMPEYEIIIWDENNFDINSNKYVRQAYENKKWAFVSDYVRLWALYNYGGFYLDTDVEMFKSIAKFSNHDFFTGFELHMKTVSPVTAVMGSKINNPFIGDLLAEYDDISFVNTDGSLNFTTNTQRITQSLVERGVNPNLDKLQVIKGDIYIYPSELFCNKTENSFTMHHFDGSWIPRHIKLRAKLMKVVRKIFLIK
jgi:mannosyltransferase OCH1-like enzyme